MEYSIAVPNPQHELFALLADSRIRGKQIQQIKARSSAKLPNMEQQALTQVQQLRQQIEAGDASARSDYLEALDNLDKIRQSIAVNADATTSNTFTPNLG